MRCKLIYGILLGLFLTFPALAQSDALAKNYFEQGQFEKAGTLYEKLLRQNPNRLDFLLSLVETYQQLEEFEKAELLLKKRLAGRGLIPQLYVDLGYNYALQDQDSLANENYDQAYSYVEQRPNYAYNIGKAFQEYSLLDRAAQVYERAMQLDPERDFNPQLARIYGEQGKMELMFEKYLDLMNTNPAYRAVAQRNFSAYVSDDPNSEANTLLRKALLGRIQKQPEPMYNKMLSWLFIQQNQFDKAFTQEKAVFRRDPENLEGIIDLVLITMEAEAYEQAEQMVQFLIDNATSLELRLEAQRYAMDVKLRQATEADYPEIESEFKKLLQEYGDGPRTFGIQMAYYEFVAYQLEQEDRAIGGLKSLIGQQLTNYQKGRAKLLLADVLVFGEKFNEALIYYSQVQRGLKNDILAQEASYKVAKTSYYKGDFEWAQIQLDVLKKSASQLIANDAMELSLMIRDNSLEDSTQTALKKYARADLLALQNKYPESVSILKGILNDHQDEAILDECLLKLGQIYEETAELDKAEAVYLQLIEQFGEDILSDDAHYSLGRLYEEKLLLPEKAKEQYQVLIFEHEDSIYFVDARKRFRRLRGDEIN
ncbi:tetratricopeptide repeat protein [Aureitalea marina]|uniref:Tetratricopeptide repeat-like domain-containing protein n=1 Tax=Aureitalea marina TaxID=930804 RepID=A0A2S7KRN6_9FLAO|nr:tetratricopeptide repeat protein [Aureitalea marina]PQB05248.1 hypothetical protein BST85_10400 [Aureitalea marina]